MEHGRIDEGSAHENLPSPLELSSTASVGKIQQIIKQPCLHQLAASCATANQNRIQQELPHSAGNGLCASLRFFDLT